MEAVRVCHTHGGGTINFDGWVDRNSAQLDRRGANPTVVLYTRPLGQDEPGGFFSWK